MCPLTENVVKDFLKDYWGEFVSNQALNSWCHDWIGELLIQSQSALGVSSARLPLEFWAGAMVETWYLRY